MSLEIQLEHDSPYLGISCIVQDDKTDKTIELRFHSKEIQDIAQFFYIYMLKLDVISSTFIVNEHLPKPFIFVNIINQFFNLLVCRQLKPDAHSHMYIYSYSYNINKYMLYRHLNL